MRFMALLSGVTFAVLATRCEKMNPTIADDTYSITTIAANGAITKKPDKAKYMYGETVSLNAVADAGYYFVNWGGGASGTNETTTVKIDVNLMVTAIFAPISTDSTVRDIDGHVYRTIKIGNQVWMAENYRVTKYNDESEIPLVTDSNIWADINTPGYCYYKNTTNQDSIKKFGALYNWYAINSKKFAPYGWHVPDTTEWNTLKNHLIANGYGCGTPTENAIAKSMAARTDWFTHPDPCVIGNDLLTNNSSGFTALPGGARDNLVNTGFVYGGDSGFWWTMTSYGAFYAFYYFLAYNEKIIYRNYFNWNAGFSVRLLKD